MADPIAYPVGPEEARIIAELARIPLFPLPEVVLFPHALLRLHIFEERYKQLVRDILTGARLLVVAALAPEAGSDPERPAVLPIAGVGEIVMSHQLPDGRFNLVVRGRTRVRIDGELFSDRLYRMVTATALPDVSGEEGEIRDADQALRALIGRLADAIPEGGELLRGVAAQASPAELVDGLASALIGDARLRQQLLETRDVGKRIERVATEVVAMTARMKPTAETN